MQYCKVEKSTAIKFYTFFIHIKSKYQLYTASDLLTYIIQIIKNFFKILRNNNLKILNFF